MGITKVKGDIGVTAVIHEMTKRGFNISLPIAEHLHYDLIAEKDGIPCRVQVKYSTLKQGVICTRIGHIWSNSQGTHSLDRSRGEFDLLACYCPQTDECYFLSDKDFDNKRAVIFRIDVPKAKTDHPFRVTKDFIDCDVAFNSWLAMRSVNYVAVGRQEIDVKKIIELKKTGKTWDEVGFAFGISGITARAHVKRSGVDIVSLRKPQEDILDPVLMNNVASAIESGKSSRSIAKDLDVSRYAVNKAICMINERRVALNGKAAPC